MNKKLEIKGYRYLYLDYLRGFFILLMIIYHFYFYLYNYNANKTIIEYLILTISSFIAPNFLLISGFAFQYFLQKNLNKPQVFKSLIIKSIYIYMIATLVSMLLGQFMGLNNSWQHWSIFKIIALAMIIVFILDKLKHSQILIVLIILVSFGLNELYINGKVQFLWFFCDGKFSFCHWVNFYLIGFIFGKIFAQFNEKGIKTNLITKTSIPALILIIVLNLNQFRSIDNVYLFYTKNISAFFILLLSAFYITNNRKFLEKSNHTLVEWGKISFSLYYIHFGLIFMIQITDKLLLSNYISSNMSLLLYIGLVILVISFLGFFVKIWKKFDYFLGLEWILKKILTTVLKSDAK